MKEKENERIRSRGSGGPVKVRKLVLRGRKECWCVWWLGAERKGRAKLVKYIKENPPNMLHTMFQNTARAWYNSCAFSLQQIQGSTKQKVHIHLIE